MATTFRAELVGGPADGHRMTLPPTSDGPPSHVQLPGGQGDTVLVYRLRRDPTMSVRRCLYDYCPPERV